MEKREPLYTVKDFPGGSDGKLSVYNVRDLGLIPGLGRFPGEGNGKPTPWKSHGRRSLVQATVHGVTKLVECKVVKSLWKRVWRLFRKLKSELPYDPTLGHISRQNYNSKRYVHPYSSPSMLLQMALFHTFYGWVIFHSV